MSVGPLLLAALATTSSTSVALAPATTSSAAVTLAPAPATAGAPAATPAREVSTQFRGQIFIRAREQKREGVDWERQYRLTRVRLSVELLYKELLRVMIEPDFADAFCAASGVTCGETELSDAFIDIRPGGAFDLRIGHAKSPFGALESESEWKLPVQQEGMVSDAISDRLGFGGRHLGVKARARFKDLPWKPSIELGGYVDLDNSGDEDAALRLIARPFKDARIELAGYARANAGRDQTHGLAGALDFTYDDEITYVVVEVLGGRALQLRRTGIDAGLDATFLGARAIGAHAFAFDVDRVWELQPYVAVEVLDPNNDTTDDVGVGIRAGANLYHTRRLRFGAELEHREATIAFVEPTSTTIALFVGVSIE